MLDERGRFRSICPMVAEAAEIEPGAKDLYDWDWVSYVDLVIAAERQLGIKLAIAEMSYLKDAGGDAGAFARLIEARPERA